jgi:hypothetical protein
MLNAVGAATIVFDIYKISKVLNLIVLVQDVILAVDGFYVFEVVVNALVAAMIVLMTAMIAVPPLSIVPPPPAIVSTPPVIVSMTAMIVLPPLSIVVTPPVIVADTLLIAVPPPVNVSMTD